LLWVDGGFLSPFPLEPLLFLAGKVIIPLLLNPFWAPSRSSHVGPHLLGRLQKTKIVA
jgi:predicted acylesterase/phospholipase RssA